MAGFWARPAKFAKRSKTDAGEYKPSESDQSLRSRVLTLNPAELELTRDDRGPVWGMLMETGYPTGVATLVAIGDGTVSLCFSSGGGVIGAGEHPAVRNAAESFLHLGPEFLPHSSVTKEFPLPAMGHTRFYFLTFDGVLTAEAKEEELGNNRHPLSPLFHISHVVISRVMEVGK